MVLPASSRFIIIATLLLLTLFLVTSPTNAANSRTTSQYTATTKGTEVIPYLSLNGKNNMVVLDLQRASFNNVEYIHYNLNYTTTDAGTQRGAEGTIYPWLPTIKSQIQFWQGKPFFRQHIPLGTCSAGKCRYDANPASFKVTVHTKYFGKAATDTTVVTLNK
jgi:hypothetical protein